MSSNDADAQYELEQKARRALNPPRTFRFNPALLAVALLVVLIVIGAMLFLSSSSTAATHSAASSTPTPAPQVATDYGTAPPNANAQVAYNTNDAMTPAPGATASAADMRRRADAARDAYNADAVADTTTGYRPEVPSISGDSDDTDTGKRKLNKPTLTVLYAAKTGSQATSATGAGDSSTFGALSTMRNNILAQESALGAQSGGDTTGTGAAAAVNTAVNAVNQVAQTASKTSFATNDSSTGSGSIPSEIPGQIEQPGAFTLPVGDHLDLQLNGDIDSSNCGTIVAHTMGDKKDPRNGALIIPDDSTLVGQCTGVHGGRVDVTWVWLRYPDLEKKPLSYLATASTEGTSGLGGHVDTHLWEQFRQTFFQNLANTPDAIIAGAVTRSYPNVVVQSGGQVQTSVSNPVPTVHVPRNTVFQIILETDYSVPHPYTGTAQ
jgi:type IV secretory pathway VirB10-like protein